MKRAVVPARRKRPGCGKPLRCSSSALRTVMTLRRSQPKHAAPRETGPDSETRLLVLERDGWACACCGRSVAGQQYALQQRWARRSRGVNSPSNLVVVCGGCQLAAEQRDPLMNAAGFWLAGMEDPREVPVMLEDAQDEGLAFRFLGPDFGVQVEACGTVTAQWQQKWLDDLEAEKRKLTFGPPDGYERSTAP
jgi:hypothetical protein